VFCLACTVKVDLVPKRRLVPVRPITELVVVTARDEERAEMVGVHPPRIR